MNHAKLLFIEDDRECDVCDKKGVCAICNSYVEFNEECTNCLDIIREIRGVKNEVQKDI